MRWNDTLAAQDLRLPPARSTLCVAAILLLPETLRPRGSRGNLVYSSRTVGLIRGRRGGGPDDGSGFSGASRDGVAGRAFVTGSSRARHLRLTAATHALPGAAPEATGRDYNRPVRPATPETHEPMPQTIPGGGRRARSSSSWCATTWPRQGYAWYPPPTAGSGGPGAPRAQT